MSKLLVVIVAVIMIAAFVPTVFAEEIAPVDQLNKNYLPIISAEEVNHQQVIKNITEAEWENWGNHNPGSGGLDNVAAFSNYSPTFINVEAGNSFYPVDLEVLVDRACVSADWDFFVNGENLDQLFSGPFMPLLCNVVDSSGQWLMPSLYFEYQGNNVAKVSALGLPLAYILRPGPANKLKLLVYASITVTESYNLRFFMTPYTIRTSPRMAFLPADTLWCSEVSLTGYQPPAEVQVNEYIIYPQTLTPGLSDVALGAGSITTNFNGELRSTRLEIHWSDQNDSLYLANWLYNIKVVFDNGESTIAVDLQDFTLTASHYAYFNFSDYFSFLPYQARSFNIFVSTAENIGITDQVWAVLGNTEEEWCFSSTSFKNLNNNQWVENIMPPYALNWPAFPIAPVMLRVGLASNIGIVNMVNGAMNQNFVDFAFTALNSDITVLFFMLYGYVQGSLGSDSLFVCRDFVNPPGAYVYVNNIANSLKLFDITVDPGMTTNLNATVESFSSTTGAATFSNMNWIIPNGQTHVLRIVGNIFSAAYQYVVEGNKWFKVDILNPNDIEAYDQSGNRVFITDQNGGVWETGIDGNGNQQPWPINNTSRLIQINDTGELYICSESNPPATNVNAGMSNVPMLNLRAWAVNEAFNINKLRIFQADSALYNRSVISATISYQKQTGELVTNTVELINGIADFNITAIPWYIPANQFRLAQVKFNLATINQSSGAFTGDKIKAEFDADANFEAKGVVSNTVLYQPTSGYNVYGNEMVVHGNVPTVTVDQWSNTNLVNGQVELYRWQVTAAEGGTDLFDAQRTFKISMTDFLMSSDTLKLQSFRVYEGGSYSSVMPLNIGILEPDGYAIWCEAGNLVAGVITAGQWSTKSIVVTYYDDRHVAAGTSKYYILKATAVNVGSVDCVSCYMYDGDNAYEPPMAADFYPENPWWEFGELFLGAVLDSDPQNLLGTEYKSCTLWSDGTGTYGDFNHQQSSYFGGFSSLDWFNGYEIKNLDVMRILTATYDDRSANGEDSGKYILPTEFKTSNFPNPFNPVTEIQFSLPEPANVILTIYDITGREVVRLADNYYSAGEHSVQFDGSALSSASGIYFYRIQTGNYVAVKKMMLVK